MSGCVKHFLYEKIMTQRRYEKQDNEREAENGMANVMVAIVTVLMALCAGVRLV